MTQHSGIETNISDTMPLRVAIQGIAGCFHDAAMRRYFINSQRPVVPVEYESFEQVVHAVTEGQAEYGAMAIENTIAGPLLPNNELLRTNAVHIVGEHKMRISHALLALPGDRLEDINEVRSHPWPSCSATAFSRRTPNGA